MNTKKIKVYVYQYTDIQYVATLPRKVEREQADQITAELKEVLECFRDGSLSEKTIHTNYEMHVLRILKHIREACHGLPRLDPEMFEFWFDQLNHHAMIKRGLSDDGDFIHRIPGGFFDYRFAELP